MTRMQSEIQDKESWRRKAPKKTMNQYLPFVMWIIPLTFLTYQFILRLWPGLMMQPIMTQFSIDASQFGIIVAFYYYGYASMQIPVAILLDRFGSRAIVATFAVLCGVATVLFTYSTNWYLACLARFLVGAGSAVGLLGVSKVISEWFPAIRYANMIGWSVSIGLIGAIYGGKPISLLIETYHWQQVAVTLAIISGVIACVAYLMLRSPPKSASHPISTESFSIKDFKAILSSPTIWIIAIANFLMVGSLEGFSDVWGVPYLMTAYAISKNNAAELVSLVFIGMMCGGPILAWCSQKWGQYTVIAMCGFGITITFSFLLLNHHYSWWLQASLLFCIGVMCCYQAIVFATGARLAKPHHLGVTIAFLNCINMLGGSFFHTAIGRLMDIFWTGAINHDGVKQYTLTAYQSALSVIPASACVGAMLIGLMGSVIYRKQRRIAG